MLNYRSQWNKINKPIDSYNSNLTVKNSAYTKEVVSYDDDQKLINQNTLKDIKNDIYIEEAYAILQDLLNLIPLK